MIKAIISDAGGVIQYWENSPVYQDIKATLRLKHNVFKTVYRELIPLLGKGHITEEEFWERFLKKTKTAEKLPQDSLFLREYAKRFKKIEEVLELLATLKKKGYKLALLSNSIPPHTAFNKTQSLYNVFDLRVISDEVGLMKPDKEIYELVLRKLAVKPEEAVFIDDLPENITAAEVLGIHGILFKNYKQLIKELENLGVTV